MAHNRLALEAADGKCALIADDDEYFRMALSAILKRELGFVEVLETASFDEAVERLEDAGHVDLALFDLSMPGIDSPAALRTVRESFQVDKLGVVSASQQRSDIISSLDAGAHGFVSKAQGVGELRRALEQILEGTIYVPPMVATLDADQREVKETARPAASPDTRSALAEQVRLTPRQWDVLQMLVEGKANKEIARALNLGPGTIKVHLAALFRNLGVSNRSAAAVAGERLIQNAAAAPGAAPRPE